MVETSCYYQRYDKNRYNIIRYGMSVSSYIKSRKESEIVCLDACDPQKSNRKKISHFYVYIFVLKHFYPKLYLILVSNAFPPFLPIHTVHSAHERTENLGFSILISFGTFEQQQ